MAAAKEKPLPKALVYSMENSSLLVVGSNTSSGQHSSDQDAVKIYETLSGTKYIQKAALIQSSSKNCTKDGLLEAIENQVSEVSRKEDGLFVLVYTGGACDIWDYGIGLEVKEYENGTEEESGFVEVCPRSDLERYSLVLNDFQADKPETHVSGKLIGERINKARPKQVQIILECPFAEKIAEEIRGSLRGCDLHITHISHTARKALPYLHTLECSTFTYFLTTIMATTEFVGGMFPLRSVFTKVETCCKALSSLNLVRKDKLLRKNTIALKSEFFKTRAVSEIESLDKDDQVDGEVIFREVLKYYNWKCPKKSKLCDEAKDWAHNVTKACLVVLNHEKVLLNDKVLLAAVGSMVYNIAFIQNEKHKGSVESSNIFIKAYMLVIAAVNIVETSIDLNTLRLLPCALEYYMKFLQDNFCAKENKDQEIKQLMEKLKTDQPDIFSQ